MLFYLCFVWKLFVFLISGGDRSVGLGSERGDRKCCDVCCACVLACSACVVARFGTGWLPGSYVRVGTCLVGEEKMEHDDISLELQ